MATTAYGVNHPLAVKAWAKRLFTEATKESYVGKFLGEGPSSLIQLRTELGKNAGDRVRVGLRMLLNGAGVAGDDTLETNEEALTTYSMDLTIDQLRHAVRSQGKMSEQRVPFSVRDEAYQGLKDWWMERLEVSLANQLVGNTQQTDTKFTGMQAATAPTANQWIFANSQASEASMSNTSAHGFSLTLLDNAVARAKTQSPKIRPVRISGKEYYCCFLHPFQVTQMRTNTNTGQWLDIQKAAMSLSDQTVASNPIFSGALGIYNGVVLHEWSYLPALTSTNANITGNVRRAVLCGAQAAVMAVGGGNAGAEATWNEELFDYGNQLGVSAGMIMGAKKTVFNNVDYGTITMSTWSPQP